MQKQTNKRTKTHPPNVFFHPEIIDKTYTEAKRDTRMKPFRVVLMSLERKRETRWTHIIGKKVAKQLLEKPPKGAFFKGMGALLR